MSTTNLDRAKLKLILKTSEGFPTQFASSKARVDAGSLKTARAGHALSQHLKGASGVHFKTKFCDLDQMTAALDLMLQTPTGQAALRRLLPGSREIVDVEVNEIFEVEADFDGTPPLKVKFDRADIRRAGRFRTSCLGVLEGRARGTDLHLHVQTLYPKYRPDELLQLLDAKTSP